MRPYIHKSVETQSTPQREWAPSAHGVHRRATVMVFVLAILAMLALVGIVLLTRTHGEFRRVKNQATASSLQAVRDGVLRKVRETLRLDIWGAPQQVGLADPGRPLSNVTPPGSPSNVLGLLENNEPWDTPGKDDRWLASTMPHMSLGNPQSTGNPTIPIEQDVLRWHRVSYLGTDVLQVYIDQTTGQPIRTPSGLLLGNPFRWLNNSRSPVISNPSTLNNQTDYGDSRKTIDPSNPTRVLTVSELADIPILQTPIPGLEAASLIPGSTTNVTIAQARQTWDAELPALIAELNTSTGASLVPRFPYFDTNADGIIDLYDADGDGVPDSPLSFMVQTHSPDPNLPRQLYAAIRIVDHASMVDVNTASSLTLPAGTIGNVAGLTFDELVPGLQRRGRSVTEFLLDGVVHRDDWMLGNNRTAGLAGYRSNGVPPDPVLLDSDIVRRTLLGGLPDPVRQYNLFGLNDEASLRHRNMLVPYDRINDRSAAIGDYRTIDRALRGSLLWSRQLNAGFSYTGNPRWSRLNANFISPANEGFSGGGNIGWRNFLDADEIASARRPLLTTLNVAVMPPPDITTPKVEPVTIAQNPNDTNIDIRLRQLWALGMSWPVLIPTSSTLLSDPNLPAEPTLLDTLTVPDNRLPAEWARVQPVDINMNAALAADVDDVKNDFVRYTAAAMYLALDGVSNYQGMPLDNNLAASAQLNREYLAWQFAANLLDYRDSDSDPTAIEWPARSGHYVFGVEKQPFFTEAYAALTAGPSDNVLLDKWFFAFELYVPPGWKIPTDHLYFRAPLAIPDLGLIPLNTFTQVTSGLPASVLDGGPVDLAMVTDGDHGNYYVFAGNTIHDVFNVIGNIPIQAQGRVFSRPDLAIALGGVGRLELVWSPDGSPANPLNHVLDVIGPGLSGDALAGGTSSGMLRWAVRPFGIADGAKKQYSLRRSTKGWRFTTAWHVYAEAPSLIGGIQPPFGQSLGRPNAVLNDLNDNIPESVWPAMTSLTTANGEVPNGFATGLPFEAFDSVVDLSRLFLLGPVNLSQIITSLSPASALPVLPDIDPILKNRDLPLTALIAQTLKGPPAGNLPGSSLDRVMAGRLDFLPVNSPEAPWTWRLFNFLTTQSHLFDGVDNDGDGLTDLADPTEAADVLFRVAGRVNLNTAPASVLRTGPFMSLLPSSPELNFFDPSQPFLDSAGTFNDPGLPQGFFWDFATAIVAVRENRSVPLRLPDASGVLQTVAVAGRNSFFTPSSASVRGGFATVIELASLNRRERKIEDVLGNRDDLFQIDRLLSDRNLRLTNHVISSPPLCANNPGLGTGDVFSPDFRFRCDNNSTDYVPIQQVPGSAIPADSVKGDPAEAAGIRGRDVYLSRLTNVYTTRSDCYTVYIALLDEDGHTVQRSQVTLDRSDCFRERPPVDGGPRRPILPRILLRTDGSYADDTK